MLDQTAAEQYSHRPLRRSKHRKFDDSITLHEKTPTTTHRNRCARLPLLLAAGRALLLHLFLEVKEGLHAYAGLR